MTETAASVSAIRAGKLSSCIALGASKTSYIPLKVTVEGKLKTERRKSISSYLIAFISLEHKHEAWYVTE